MNRTSVYKTRIEWYKADRKAYRAAERSGLLEEICRLFGWSMPAQPITKKKPNGYWTKERCVEDARRFSNQTEWQKKSQGSYSAAIKNGWYADCVVHMTPLQNPKNYWTKDRCLEEALKHSQKSHWVAANATSYRVAKKNGWFNECCAHMSPQAKPFRYWQIKENCVADAKKYKSISEWQGKSAAYQNARINGWFNECTAHMVPKEKHKGFWSIKDNCINEARKYKSITKWRAVASRSVTSAVKNGWYNECTAHMVRSTKPNGYWNLEKCKEEALKFNTKAEWVKNSNSSYLKSIRNGWLKECTAHMTKRGK